MRSTPPRAERPKIAPWLSAEDLRNKSGESVPVPNRFNENSNLINDKGQDLPGEGVSMTHSNIARVTTREAPADVGKYQDESKPAYHASKSYAGLFDSVFQEAMHIQDTNEATSVDGFRGDNASDDSAFTFRGMTSCSIEENVDPPSFCVSDVGEDKDEALSPSATYNISAAKNEDVTYSAVEDELDDATYVKHIIRGSVTERSYIDPSSNKQSVERVAGRIVESQLDRKVASVEVLSENTIPTCDKAVSFDQKISTDLGSSNKNIVNSKVLGGTSVESRAGSDRVTVLGRYDPQKRDLVAGGGANADLRINYRPVYPSTSSREIHNIGTIANKTGEIHYITRETYRPNVAERQVRERYNSAGRIYAPDIPTAPSYEPSWTAQNNNIHPLDESKTATANERIPDSSQSDSDTNREDLSEQSCECEGTVETHTGNSQEDQAPQDTGRERSDNGDNITAHADISQEFVDGLLDLILVEYDNPVDTITFEESEDLKFQRINECFLTGNYAAVLQKADQTLIQYKQLRDQERSFFSSKQNQQAAIASDPLYFLVYSYHECKHISYEAPEDARFSGGTRLMFHNEEDWNGEERSAVHFFHGHLKKYMCNVGEMLHRPAEIHTAECEFLEPTDNREINRINKQTMLRMLYLAKFNFEKAAEYYSRRLIWRNCELPIVLSRSEWRLATTAITSRPLLACIYPVGRDKCARPLIVIRLLPIIKIHNKLVVTEEDYNDYLRCLKKLLVFWFEFAISFLMSPNTIEQFSIIVDFCQNVVDIETVREYSSTLLWIYTTITELRLQYATRINKIFLLNFQADAMGILRDKITCMDLPNKIYVELDENYVYNNGVSIPISDVIGISQMESSYGGARKAFYDWKPLFRFVKAFCVSHKVYDIERRFDNVLDKTAQSQDGRSRKISFRSMFKSAFGVN